MNILVINGSPKGEKSNSYQLTNAFLRGIKESDSEAAIRRRTVCQMDIRPCLGCFSCWNRTPGKCCMEDDMAQVIQDLLWADITVWSFPLYYYTVPGELKNLIDRQLPMLLPFMEEKEGQAGNGGHPSRYDMSGKRTVLISTCGFYTAEGNYDGVYSLSTISAGGKTIRRFFAARENFSACGSCLRSRARISPSWSRRDGNTCPAEFPHRAESGSRSFCCRGKPLRRARTQAGG